MLFMAWCITSVCLLGLKGVNVVYGVVYFFCLLIGTEGVNVVYGVVYSVC